MHMWCGSAAPACAGDGGKMSCPFCHQEHSTSACLTATIHSGVTAAPDPDLLDRGIALLKALIARPDALAGGKRAGVDAALQAVLDAVTDAQADKASWRRVAEGLQRDLTTAEAKLEGLREERDNHQYWRGAIGQHLTDVMETLHILGERAKRFRAKYDALRQQQADLLAALKGLTRYSDGTEGSALTLKADELDTLIAQMEGR